MKRANISSIFLTNNMFCYVLSSLIILVSFFFVLIFLFQPIFIFAQEIIIESADSVWISSLEIPTSDVLNSNDADQKNLFQYAFISHADSVWNSDLTTVLSDVTDSTDTTEERVIKWAFIGHADNVSNFGLEGESWKIPTDKWSFAIITDLHIGRGYSDYDGTGYGDSGNGEDYYLTERLKKVVNWINENKNNIDCDGTKCSVKFLAVLGDITNTAEKSQFLKAKMILDELNDPNSDGNTSDGIPYIPVFGNHDVWPYTDKGEASSTLGENYFEEIFWDGNATNMKLLKARFNFQRDEVNSKYKNFAFSYGKMNFIGLDFMKRAKTGEAEIYPEAENWLRNKLNEYQGKEPVILFSHHPLAKPFSRDFYITRIWNFDLEEIEKIKNIIEDYENITEGKQVLGNFAGHIHGYYPQEILGFNIPEFNQFMDANWQYPLINETPVLTTEAMMVGGNEKDINNKGIIRIVKINEENSVDFSEIEGKFPATNPYISIEYKILPGQVYPCVFFKAHIFSRREYSIFWEFGDGNTDSGAWKIHCYSLFQTPQIYNVKLTATDKETGEKEYITRKVEVKEGIIPKIIKITEDAKQKIELISTELEENVTNFGRTMKDTILIRLKPHSPATPIGLINVHFEQATENIDLSNLIADTDLGKRKSMLFMPEWPKEVEKEKVLFIPK